MTTVSVHGGSMAGFSKVFSTIWGGSLYGHFEASAVFLVFLSLADRNGDVDMTPEAIAGTTGWPLDFIRKGIKELEAPDRRSRTKGHEGRRILPTGEDRDWGWRITNYSLYRDKMRSADRKEYLAEKQREYRARDKVSTTVDTSTIGDQNQPIAEADTEAEAIKKPLTRPTDALWESLMEACGIDDKKRTKSESGAWNKALRELKDAGATPRVIQGRARAFRKKWPEATLTPTALARRWNECIADNGGASEV